MTTKKKVIIGIVTLVVVATFGYQYISAKSMYQNGVSALNDKRWKDAKHDFGD